MAHGNGRDQYLGEQNHSKAEQQIRFPQEKTSGCVQHEGRKALPPATICSTKVLVTFAQFEVEC